VSTIAEVWLWNTRIGAVLLPDGDMFATFEYDPDFLNSGVEVAPLTMPLSTEVFRFPELTRRSFHGLPGLLADALPDKYGNDLINAWLSTQGRSPTDFNAVERLCYTGSRGMGALEFRPTTGPAMRASAPIDINALVDLASGGARAKAVIAWNPTTNVVRSGQVEVPDGFQYWLLKFDGVANNKDHDLADPQGYGAVEYAYSEMAIAAGIKMMPCRLLEENGRRHFMTRRFDRNDEGGKLHMQSLAAMAHYDFNEPGAYSYEQAFDVMRRLELPATEMEEQVRRMAFNVIARNQDDHVKNIAFLMDRDGRWRLSPAYDVNWAYNPTGDWTSLHQMSVNSRRDGFDSADLIACATFAGITQRKAKSILADVDTAVGEWHRFAKDAQVKPAWIGEIAMSHRRSLA
jgi:serine/threonine-protein kinase HipA